MVNHFIGVLKINLIGLLRYGNPDIQYLATLKNEIQIYNILIIPMKNLRSDFILDAFLYFVLKNVAKIWQP